MLGAIVFALVSLLCLLLAGREWSRSRAPATERPAVPGPGWPEGAVFLVASLSSLGALWVLADLFGWNRDRTLWLGFAGFLALMTVLRPTWFWENYRARWLRGVVGDEGTVLLYLLLAGIMVWVGFYTDWTFGRR